MFIGKSGPVGVAAELGVKNDTTNIGLEANHQTDESTLTRALTLISFCLWEGGRGVMRYKRERKGKEGKERDK